jgi:DNA polymerase I
MSSPLAGVQLHLVTSIEDVLEMKRWASERRDTPMGVDVETTGLDRVKDRVRLIQLGDKFHGWAVPDIWGGAAVEIMRDYEGEFVGHNIFAFDSHHIAQTLRYQIPLHKLHDTMFLAALSDPLKPKGLKPLATRLIDKNATAGQRLLDDGMKANGWTWATVPYDFPPWWAYGALDPVLTCWLWDMLYPQIHGTADEAYDLERAVAPLLGKMMNSGILLDKKWTAEKLTELRTYITSAREWLKSVHNIDSLMSAKQLRAGLSAAGIEVTGVTKTGLPSVTKEVLGEISRSQDAPQAARDLAGTVLKARHADKMAGTYLENFTEMAKFDGVIHCAIQQLAARTSRMSITSPALQTLPRDDKIIRGCFIPREGKSLISIDASQIELRLAASLCGDDGLITAIREADETGADIYCGIASMLFGETIIKTDKRRQFTKNAGYCKIYGGGVRKIAITIGLPFEQAKQMNDMYDERFPMLSSFAGELIAIARQQVARGERPHARTDTGSCRAMKINFTL